MPKFVIAHKSGAHRLAAIALYRALVSQCKKLDIPADRGEELHHLIKNRFSSFRHTTSHRELKLLFEAGYQAVDHLDAAVAGEEKSKQYVLDLLRKAPYGAKKGNTVTRRFISEEYNDPFGSHNPQHAAVDASKDNHNEERPVVRKRHAAEKGQSLISKYFVDWYSIRHMVSEDHPDFIRPASSPVSEQSTAQENNAIGTSSRSLAVDAGKDHHDDVQPLIRKHLRQEPLVQKYSVDVETKASQHQAAEFINQSDSPDGASANAPPIRHKIIEGSRHQPRFAPLDASPETVAAMRTSIFDRAIPREELGGTGKRQIPKIFSANQIPVLRFKKPQSPALTGYLNSRIEQRQKRHNLRQSLEAQLQVAILEDQWDRILDAHADVNRAEFEDHSHQGFNRLEPRWQREIQFELNRVNGLLDAEKAKNRDMAEKMYGVIDRETKLLEEEREQERWEEARRIRETAEGLEGLSDMIEDIMNIGDTVDDENRPFT